MNDEQLRQTSEMPAEQAGGPEATGGNGSVSPAPQQSGEASHDAGTTLIVQDAADADALTSYHPGAPVGGTPEQTSPESLPIMGGAPEDTSSSDGAQAGTDADAGSSQVADGGSNEVVSESAGPVAEAEPASAPAYTGGTADASSGPSAGQVNNRQAEYAGGAGGERQDSSDDGDMGEVQVVRSARDPRLNDMAPNASMEDLLRASEQQYRQLKHGDVIEGTVMKVDRDEILIDIGAKSEGIIPSHELQSLSEEERTNLQIGDELLVSVVQPENNEGHAVLSLDRARQEKSWRDLQKRFEAGEIIQAEVSGYNKGGLLVNLGGVRGFVPSSQVSSIPAGDANKQAAMAGLQGKALPLKIIEINRGRNRLILSERQAMQEQREGMRSRLLRELEPGQIRPGTVSSICDFGAFVDIGGADGLIHLSELSWKRVSHPSEVLKVGDRINVYVLSVDPNERKIALSLKRTQPEPWSTITDNYQLGQLVRGTITQLTSFGAFARLEDGIEGLIHVSELAEGRVAHPRNVVKEGDVVDLKVIRIDPARKRIGLSLKRVNEDASGEGMGGSVVDEDTAAAGAVPTLGASGVENEQGDAQEDMMPALGGGTMEMQPNAAARAFAQGTPRQQQQQQPRQQQQQPPRLQSNVRADLPRPEEAEPLGAMAHAFAMLAQRQGQVSDAEPDTDETPTPTAQASTSDVASPEAEASTAPEASAPEASAPEASAPEASAPEASAPEASAPEASAPEASAPEATASVAEDSGGTDEPEAMMPSAADMDTAETDTADAVPSQTEHAYGMGNNEPAPSGAGEESPADSNGEASDAGSGAPSGSEGAPSVGDSTSVPSASATSEPETHGGLGAAVGSVIGTAVSSVVSAVTSITDGDKDNGDKGDQEQSDAGDAGQQTEEVPSEATGEPTPGDETTEEETLG